jgi:hypothetical protein
MEVDKKPSFIFRFIRRLYYFLRYKLKKKIQKSNFYKINRITTWVSVILLTSYTFYSLIEFINKIGILKDQVVTPQIEESQNPEVKHSEVKDLTTLANTRSKYNFKNLLNLNFEKRRITPLLFFIISYFLFYYNTKVEVSKSISIKTSVYSIFKETSKTVVKKRGTFFYSIVGILTNSKPGPGISLLIRKNSYDHFLYLYCLKTSLTSTHLFSDFKVSSIFKSSVYSFLYLINSLSLFLILVKNFTLITTFLKNISVLIGIKNISNLVELFESLDNLELNTPTILNIGPITVPFYLGIISMLSLLFPLLLPSISIGELGYRKTHSVLSDITDKEKESSNYFSKNLIREKQIVEFLLFKDKPLIIFKDIDVPVSLEKYRLKEEDISISIPFKIVPCFKEEDTRELFDLLLSKAGRINSLELVKDELYLLESSFSKRISYFYTKYIEKIKVKKLEFKEKLIKVALKELKKRQKKSKIQIIDSRYAKDSL